MASFRVQLDMMASLSGFLVLALWWGALGPSAFASEAPAKHYYQCILRIEGKTPLAMP